MRLPKIGVFRRCMSDQIMHLHAYVAASLVYQGRNDEARDLLRRVPRVPVGLGQSYKDPSDNAHIANALDKIGWEVDSDNPGVWGER